VLEDVEKQDHAHVATQPLGQREGIDAEVKMRRDFRGDRNGATEFYADRSETATDEVLHDDAAAAADLEYEAVADAREPREVARDDAVAGAVPVMIVHAVGHAILELIGTESTHRDLEEIIIPTLTASIEARRARATRLSPAAAMS
jgi:hypothetical protein